MSQLEELKEIREKIENNTCTISDLKDIYENVNTKFEMILAKKGDIQHLYYRDTKRKTVILEENLLPYEKNIYIVKNHINYPLDLCIPIFYDEEINRYGQGIIIPRIRKFVMVDDMNLIQKPDTESFYTRGINENNENCGSIVDLKGNIYRMYGYGNESGDFTFSEIKGLNPYTLFMQSYGTLVYYKGNTVYADICISPYIILDKESLRKYVGNLAFIDKDIEKFDAGFMQGKRYVKNRKLNKL